ncbi:guanylate cyclase [Leptospira gomenensis]|uniref:Guanylate cyclase n=1 Tax=Leptospira gomenensis TaxID=2484974 RepID=A0A5F1Z2M2_9LEPT|nr:guanylate cyclase [Leptospira gomenensis]TGK43390.1 guanylate cyclase [Leptospira gomenensis]TGK45416.1 guanylate cyclase [Leptospira gomenensis]TGK66283.1 guanylate cyclase [Leptospira gomenensis]
MFQSYILRFLDPKLEAEFRFFLRNHIATFVRIGAISAMIGYVAVFVLFYDVLLIRDQRVLWIMAGSGLFGTALFTSTFPRFRRWMVPFSVFSNLMGGAVAVFVGFVFIRSQHAILLTVLIIVAYYAFLVLRIRTLPAFLCTSSYLAAYQFLLLNDPLLGSQEKMIYSFLIWFSEFFAVIAGYTLELTTRKLFLQAKTIEEQTKDLEREKEKSDLLLRNILPDVIADRLKNESSQISEYFSECSILFADIVGFTLLAARKSPDELAGLLDRFFSRLDELAEKRGVEKIKTIGDAYMAAAGIPIACEDHAARIGNLALDIIREVNTNEELIRENLNIRIGIHSGPVVAGVIGRKKFIYDLWGDAVNLASRMESHGLPGKIHVTEEFHKASSDLFRLERRGEVDIKGKGIVSTYFLAG